MTSDRAAQRTYAEAERIRYWWQVERERLLSTLARVNPDLWLEPMGEGEWSCHELLAHRTFWEAWELEAYQEYVKGKPPGAAGVPGGDARHGEPEGGRASAERTSRRR